MSLSLFAISAIAAVIGLMGFLYLCAIGSILLISLWDQRQLMPSTDDELATIRRDIEIGFNY